MRIGDIIYLDHQATTPVDPRVFAAMEPYFAREFGNPHSADHILGWRAAQAVERSTTTIGSWIGADPDEIVFTSGATEANNLAILGLGRRAKHQKRKRILVSAIEHACVLEAVRALSSEYGFLIESIPVDSEGFIDLDTLRDLISDDVLLVSVMAVNNEIGTVQDIARIAEIVHEAGAFLHCDSAQAPMAISMQDLCNHADLLTLSAHKMYGPVGIGVLYVRRDLQNRVEPLIYGGGQQLDLRSGTVPVTLCVGMAEAIRLAQSDDGINARQSTDALRTRFVKHLATLSPFIRLNGPTINRHPGNANILFEGYDGHELLGILQPFVAASTGSACSSGLSRPSHVLRAIGLSEQEAQASIRFSLGKETTADDVDEAARRIEDALSIPLR